MSSTVTVKVRPGNERMMASFVRALDEVGTLQVAAFSVSYAAGGILAVPEAETTRPNLEGETVGPTFFPGSYSSSVRITGLSPAYMTDAIELPGENEGS